MHSNLLCKCHFDGIQNFFPSTNIHQSIIRVLNKPHESYNISPIMLTRQFLIHYYTSAVNIFAINTPICINSLESVLRYGILIQRLWIFLRFFFTCTALKVMFTLTTNSPPVVHECVSLRLFPYQFSSLFIFSNVIYGIGHLIAAECVYFD